MSYTEYDVQVNGKIVRQEQEYLVPVKVTNLGNMTGKTVVQIYIGKKKIFGRKAGERTCGL